MLNTIDTHALGTLLRHYTLDDVLMTLAHICHERSHPRWQRAGCDLQRAARRYIGFSLPAEDQNPNG